MGKANNTHSIYGSWGPAHKTSRSRLADCSRRDKDGKETPEKIDHRLPFEVVPHFLTPGPYNSAHCFQYLSNQHHWPCTKFSTGPKFENAQKRFYSWEHLEHSNRGEFSPGPIYKVQSDFEQEELPPRPKHITKRQSAPWQRNQCPGEPGCHVTAWGDEEPEKRFFNPLFPYKNAHKESDSVPFDEDITTMYLRKARKGTDRLMAHTGASKRRASRADLPASLSLNAELLEGLRAGLEGKDAEETELATKKANMGATDGSAGPVTPKKKPSRSEKGTKPALNAWGMSVDSFTDSLAVSTPTHSASRMSLTSSASGMRQSRSQPGVLISPIRSKPGPAVTGFTCIGAKKVLANSQTIERSLRQERNTFRYKKGITELKEVKKTAWNASTGIPVIRAKYFGA